MSWTYLNANKPNIEPDVYDSEVKGQIVSSDHFSTSKVLASPKRPEIRPRLASGTTYQSIIISPCQSKQLQKTILCLVSAVRCQHNQPKVWNVGQPKLAVHFSLDLKPSVSLRRSWVNILSGLLLMSTAA